MIIEEYGLSQTEGGLLVSVTFLAFAVVQIPIGVVSDIFDSRKIFAVGLSTLGLGIVVLYFSQTFFIALLARTLIGLGGGIMPVPLFRLIVDYFPLNQRGRALGLINIMGQSGSFASVSVPAVLIYASQVDWRAFLLTTALASPILILFILLSVKPTIKKTNYHRRLRSIMRDNIVKVSTNRRVWPLWTFSFFFQGAILGLMSWAPAILSNAGYSFEASTLVGSMVPLATVFGMAFGGLLADRTPRKRPVMIYATILHSLVLYAFLMFLRVNNYYLIAIILFASGFFMFNSIVIFSWIPDFYSAEQRGTCLGMTNGIIFFGACIWPVIMGLILDLTNSLENVILLLLASQIAALAAAFVSPRHESVKKETKG